MSVVPPPISPLHPWLAPLAGHSDLALRVLCREEGAAVACTEMVNAKGLVYNAKSSKGSNGSENILLTLPLEGFPADAQADSPLVVQLFGDDAYFLGEALRMLADRGFKYFDLNLGCSVPKVVKTGAGAAMGRHLKNTAAAAKAMLQAADDAGGLPVGFKIRLGWTREEENYLDVAKALQDAGAAWLCLHPRYAKQGFSGEADWSALEKLKTMLHIPLIASGDLFDAASATRCLAETGADAPMFARGALNNPGIFNEYIHRIKHGDWQKSPKSQATHIKQMVLRHAELARSLPQAPKRKKRGEERPASNLLKMRGAIPRYIKDLPGSRALRIALTKCQSWEEFYALVNNFFDGLDENLQAQCGTANAELAVNPT